MRSETIVYQHDRFLPSAKACTIFPEMNNNNNTEEKNNNIKFNKFIRTNTYSVTL